MHKIYKKILGLVCLWLPVAATATPINDYQFKSPSFNGSGYGTYALTIENEQYTRQQAVQQQIQSAMSAAASAAQNTPLQQFLTNLESRIYAQISQNVATSMFSAAGAVQPGSIAFGAGNITWSQTIMKDGTSGIQLQVFDGMNTTTVNVPMGQFTAGKQ